MEIERIGENKIRCALTEEEINQLGFDVDEIIGNSETTQQFMRVVLGLVEEQGNINMENISPMVKAELLQNHSMAITFGEESSLSFKDLVDTMSHILRQWEEAQGKEKDSAELDSANPLEEMRRLNEDGQAEEKSKKAVEPHYNKKKKLEPMICALRFAALEDMRRMCHVCFPDKVPKSCLYKLEAHYFLILDFTGFSKLEMRPFAFGTVEYDDAHYSDPGQIAHFMEHGTCIMKNQAIEMLMQL